MNSKFSGLCIAVGVLATAIRAPAAEIALTFERLGTIPVEHEVESMGASRRMPDEFKL